MSIFDLFKKSKPAAATATAEKEAAEKEAAEKPSSDSQSTTFEGAKRVHNLIIIDESGSMQSIYRPALSGLNETLQTIREAQKEHEEQEQYVTLIAFDSVHYNQIYNNTPAEKTVDVTEAQYRPGGCTPLFDAMGRSITELRPNVEKEDVVLVTIITDGYENASSEYNASAIKSLVETMKGEGWVFTYIGANQDVVAVGASMAIDNVLAFSADAESTKAMFEKENRSRKRFIDKTRAMKHPDSCKDYFKEFDDDDEAPRKS